MARGKAGGITAALERALSDELKEVTRRHAEGETDDAGVSLAGKFIYSSTERMKILDRCIKLETLKLKIDDPGFGANFGKGGDEK